MARCLNLLSSAKGVPRRAAKMASVRAGSSIGHWLSSSANTTLNAGSDVATDAANAAADDIAAMIAQQTGSHFF